MKRMRLGLAILIVVLAVLGIAFPVSASVPEEGKAPVPPLTEIAARDDVVIQSDMSLLGGVTGCYYGKYSPGRTIKGTNGKSYWAGVIHVTINGMETPVFCIDLHHHIYKGHCFQALGPTSEAVTWLLNNYPPSFSLTNDEAAARQAAIWYFSDGFVIASPASVAARAQEIINSVPDPLYLPLNPPKLTITPASRMASLQRAWPLSSRPPLVR